MGLQILSFLLDLRLQWEPHAREKHDYSLLHAIQEVNQEPKGSSLQPLSFSTSIRDLFRP